ncbi:MAG TPA: hypothetical protein VGT03_13025 [Candidatus Acidoferrales bacterium]|nr:hypothetical protein [Candidatus Acidoferrales bacterium]
MRMQKPQFPSIFERRKRVVRKSRWLKRAAPAALLALCCLAPLTESQQPAEAIVIGGQRFELGMPKDAALAKLAECCTLNGSGDVFSIEPKQPPFEIWGTVWFAAGKVVRLRAHIDQFQETQSVDLGQTLYRSIKELTASQGLRVTVHTEETEGQGSTTRDIYFNFANGRSLVLEINKVDSNPKYKLPVGDWVDVFNELGEP